MSGGLTAESDIVVVVELVDSLDLTTNVEFRHLGVEVLDGRVLRIAAKDQLGFLVPGGGSPSAIRVIETHRNSGRRDAGQMGQVAETGVSHVAHGGGQGDRQRQDSGRPPKKQHEAEDTGKSGTYLSAR